jgi:hypothetical protein
MPRSEADTSKDIRLLACGFLGVVAPKFDNSFPDQNLQTQKLVLVRVLVTVRVIVLVRVLV